MIDFDRAIGPWSYADVFATRRIDAHSTAGSMYSRRLWVGMPQIPSWMLKCTFYLYRTREDAKKGDAFGGTGFIVGVQSVLEPNYFIRLPLPIGMFLFARAIA
jgi:hypothetical protein